MFYLYLKLHNKTGLKYLGMTTRNPIKYKGSGLHWQRHIKENGYDVTTTILKQCETKEELSEWGMFYSTLWNVVESTEYANLVPEDGINSCGMRGKKHTHETKEKIRASLMGHEVSDLVRETSRKTLTGKDPWNKGKKFEYHVHSEEELKRRSKAMIGDGNPFFGKTHSDEFKTYQAENQKRKIECPYCGKAGAIRIMSRWHFDKCREKEKNDN